MKDILRILLRYAAFHVPWGARRIMLDACLDRMRFSEMYDRVLPRFKLAEIAAAGDRGVVASAAGDTMVITEYAQTGAFASVATETLLEFFAPNGGTYMDIGANIGLMTIPLARNPRIHCVAFEPAVSVKTVAATVRPRSNADCRTARRMPRPTPRPANAPAW